MVAPESTRIDFDDWSRLATRDPQAFESRRRAVLEAFVAGCPASRRQRLASLQWRIDRERDLSATPLAGCIRLSNMMWQAFAGPDGLNSRLNHTWHTRPRNDSRVIHLDPDRARARDPGL